MARTAKAGWRGRRISKLTGRPPFAVLAAVVMLMVGVPTARAAAVAVAHGAEMSAAAPAGFDRLEQPQTTMVDVYFGGERVTTAMASFTPASLTFLHPDKVLSSIPHLKSSAEIVQVLAAPMATNAGRACYVGAAEPCGRLNPAVAGVIFDEGRFRAEVFVNPAYQDVDTPLRSRYLPEPEGPPSMVSVTSGVISGSTAAHPAYGFQNRTVIAFRAMRLIADVSQSSGVHFQAETLAAVVDHGALRYQAGLLRTQGLEFFGEGRVAGVSVGTQLDTLLNRDLVSATPILVYLNQRSQVELYRLARLVSSRSYDVGNQLIDTSALPDGAYEVVMRIREAGGQMREERRFFTRNRTLPPLGRPQFQFTAGAMVRQSGDIGGASSGSPYAQISYARRLTPAVAVDADLALVGRDPVAAVGATYFSRGVRLHAEAVQSGRSERGVLLDAALDLSDHFTIAVNARRAWGHEAFAQAAQVIDGPFASTTTILTTPPVRSREGFVGAGTQVSASLSYVRGGVQFGLLGSYSGAAFTRTSYAVGASVEAPLRWRRFDDLRVYANAAQTDRGLQATIGLRLRLSHGRSGVFADGGYTAGPRDNGQGTGPASQVSANTAVNTRAGELAAAANYSHTPDRDTAGVSARVRGPVGDYGLMLERDLRGAGADTRYSADFVVAAASAGGKPVLGSATGGDSGVIVHVQGDVDRASFRVMVNDAPVGTVRAGSAASVFLSPYHTYRVRLAPLEGAAVDFDTGERRVTLYPGNMSSLTWTAERDLEIFGRIVDDRGLPIVNALISGARAPSFTDAHGYFQMSVLAGRELSVRKSDGRICRLTLPLVKLVNGYAGVGARTCVDMQEPASFARR